MDRCIFTYMTSTYERIYKDLYYYFQFSVCIITYFKPLPFLPITLSYFYNKNSIFEK